MNNSDKNPIKKWSFENQYFCVSLPENQISRKCWYIEIHAKCQKYRYV